MREVMGYSGNRSHSSDEKFKTCPRLYQLDVINDAESERTVSLDIGLAWHRYMEDGHVEKLPGLAGLKLEAMVLGYERHWGWQEDLTSKPRALVEEKLVYQGHSCIIDRLEGDERGVFIIEYKTTSSRDLPGKAEAIVASGQLQRYQWILEGLGLTVEGCILDIVRVPAIRIKRNESEEEFAQRLIENQTPDHFLRYPVRLSQEDIHTWKLDSDAFETMIAGCNEAGYWPRNTSKCYNMFGGVCRWTDLCGT